MSNTLAFLGPHGTFTEEAARCLFLKSDWKFIPLQTIPDVLAAVDQGEASIGVVPIENSIEGSVNLTLDWLVHELESLRVIGELAYPISQHLISTNPQVDFNAITKLLSHPHAIAQCRRFIADQLPHAAIEYATSTAEAIKLVSTHADEKWAAIGTRLGAELYGLCLREQEIQDFDNNFTRFIIVEKGTPRLIANEFDGFPASSVLSAARISRIEDKTSLLITLPTDYPGALHQVLSAFAWRKINLSRIESRPTKKKLGTYYFFIDIENPSEQILLTSAIGEIEAIGCQVRILGSYPVFSSSQD